MLGGADNPNGELPSYITGADIGSFPERATGSPRQTRRIHTASCLPSQRSSNRACSSSVTRIVSILSRFIGIIIPMNRNPPYTEASVTKQEKTALNMARFIRSQTLTLLEKLNELDADEQADICESLHDHADELYRSCLARFGDDGENL